MGLIYGGVPWGHTTLAGLGRWDWFMGKCHGGARLDRGNGIDLWGRAMGRATLARSGQWDWVIGACHVGVQHWLDWAMGLILGVCYGAYNTGCIGVMGLMYGDASWGPGTGSGWWNWFVGACHGAHDIRWIWAMGLIYGGTPWGHVTGSGVVSDL